MVNKSMVILARESRGITQADLAERIGVVNGTLSRIENGGFNISEEIIGKVAEITGYPTTFFHQEGGVYPEHLTYRKRDKVAQKLLTRLNARVNITRMHVQYFIDELKVVRPILSVYEVDETNTPAVIAGKLKKAWRLKASDMIANMVELLESNGIVVTSFDFGTERVDSRCVLTDEQFPVIILNSTLHGDRQRFSLAYQLGHLVMHTSTNAAWDRDIAHEANLFASEFLMPENAIRKDFEQGVSIALLGDLKLKWKVSMIALFYRADDLGYITANQKRYLLQQFNEQKMRRREPKELDVPIETPRMIKNWIKEMKLKKKLNDEGVADILHLNIEDLHTLYN